MSNSDYEQPVSTDAVVDDSDDYTEYTFSTTKGMRFGLLVTYIQYTILAKKDCIEVQTFPKKANKMPFVRYDDIASMRVKRVFSWYHICLAICTFYTVIFPLLFLYFGSNHKLEITLKSGAKTSVCASSKDVINNFATDLNQRIIQKCGHSVLI